MISGSFNITSNREPNALLLEGDHPREYEVEKKLLEFKRCKPGYEKLKLLLESLQTKNHYVLEEGHFNFFSELLGLAEIADLDEHCLLKRGEVFISESYGPSFLIDFMCEAFVLIKKNPIKKDLIEKEIEKTVEDGRTSFNFSRGSDLYGISLFLELTGLATYEEVPNQGGQELFIVTINQLGIALINRLINQRQVALPLAEAPTSKQVAQYYDQRITINGNVLIQPRADEDEGFFKKIEFNFIRFNLGEFVMKFIDKSVKTGDVGDSGTVMGAGSRETRNDGFQLPKPIVIVIAIGIFIILIIFALRLYQGKDRYNIKYNDLEIKQQSVETQAPGNN